MAKEADHISLANKNNDALLHLLKEAESFPEWVTTVAFYKSVQIVEAVFRRKLGRNSNSHSNRLDTLKVTPFKGSGLFKHYRLLWSASMVARYLHDKESQTSFSTFTDYIPANAVVQRIIKNRLMPLEQISLPMLSEQGRKTLTRIRV